MGVLVAVAELSLGGRGFVVGSAPLAQNQVHMPLPTSTGLHSGHLHSTRGLFLTTTRTHFTFGKKVLASHRSWEAEFPPAATAVADALAKAGCTEFKANAGALNLQDECMGLCARPCATPIPISRSGNPGPSSTRLLPSTPAHVRVILSLPSSFTVFA